MNWIQWYLIVLIVFGAIVNMAIHGNYKEGHYDFRLWFVSIVLMLPIYGRVLAWW